MRRSFPVNINGRIYNIDEDAYQRLNQYFDNLRTAFANDPEVAEDIEARVAEHFDSNITNPNSVVTLADVNRVILTMGQPDEICDGDTAPHAESDSGIKVDCNSAAQTPPPYQGVSSRSAPQSRRLYRDTSNTVLGGVLSGLAVYMGWDPTAIRILFVVITLLTAFWPMFIGYLIAWLVIPAANTPSRQLQMRGYPVTVDNVGRNTLYTENAVSTGGGFWSFVGKLFMAFVGFFAGVIGLTLLLGILGCIVALCVLPFSVSSYSILGPDFGEGYMGVVSALIVFLIFIIPCAAVVWAACSVLFGSRGAGRRVVVSALIIEALLIAGLIASMFVGQGLDGSFVFCSMSPVLTLELV